MLPREPRQYRFGLRVIREAVDGHRKIGVRQYFQRIARLEIALAGTRDARELPRRDEIVNKRIVHPFRELMAKRKHVGPAGRENVGVGPCGKREGLDLLIAVSVHGRKCSVQAQNAAIVEAVLVKKSVVSKDNRKRRRTDVQIIDGLMQTA